MLVFCPNVIGILSVYFKILVRVLQESCPDVIGLLSGCCKNHHEYEELIRLRTENEYMKAEIEVIKKEIALREEKEAARLKAKKQRSSRNSGPKDSN